jgi:DNA polymerase III sliding clamp (beta) subunit (PCNA family)
VKVSFEAKPDNDGGLVAKSVVIDTELVKYRLESQEGEYPDYGKVIPSEFTASASFDTKEAVKAIQSLLAVWYDDKLKPLYRPLTLTISPDRLTIEAKEERGKAEIKAETSGEGKIRVNGKYLIRALKACGGIADLKLVNAESPMLFTNDGYRCLVSPMAMEEVEEAKAEAKAEVKTEAEAQPKHKGKQKGKGKTDAVEQAEAVARATTEAEDMREKVPA